MIYNGLSECTNGHEYTLFFGLPMLLREKKKRLYTFLRLINFLFLPLLYSLLFLHNGLESIQNVQNTHKNRGEGLRGWLYVN